MILLRHCQSVFNLHFTRTRRDPGIVDPPLTEEGEAQAIQAADALCGPGAAPIERLLVSPYRRALQTVAPIAARLGLVPEIVPLVRERFAFTCDVGSSPASLQRDWPALDFSGLDEVWWHDGRRDADGAPCPETEDSTIARAEAFRAEMAAHPRQDRTLLVSHWGFLLSLTGRSLENGMSVTHDPSHRPPGPIVWRH